MLRIGTWSIVLAVLILRARATRTSPIVRFIPSSDDVLALTSASLVASSAFARNLAELCDETGTPWVDHSEPERSQTPGERPEPEPDRDAFSPATATC